jgi:epoxyqueuosine reductase
MSAKLRFIQHLEKNGCYASVVSAEHAVEIGEEIRSLHEEGRIDDALYNDYAKPYFTPQLPKSLPKAKSIIVVSVPQPMVRTTFRWMGHAYQFVIPPTYYDGNKVDQRVRRLLWEGFKPKSYRLVRATLPVKLLAVRSGLALYGRNNVTYVPKHGSFHRLTAFYSDYDSPIDNWREKKALPLCDKCKACLKACPTGAIMKDRFQIKADRCLSYLNEKISGHEFPKWVDASAHNSLVGCMRCQRVCPYDRDVADWYEDRGVFTEKETEYLLNGKFRGVKAEKMEKKLKRIGIDLTIFPRNLETLLAQQRR